MRIKAFQIAILILGLMFVNGVSQQFMHVSLMPTTVYWIGLGFLLYAAYQSMKGIYQHHLTYGYMALIIYMVIVGLSYNNNVEMILRDLAIQLFLLAALITGYSLTNLRPILKTFVYVLIFGAIINIIAVLSSPIYIRSSDTSDFIRPLAYQVQYVLLPILVLFFIKETFLRENKNIFYLIYIVFVLYFFEQLLFAKRVMFIKFFVIIALNIYYYYNFKNRSAKSQRILLILIVLLFLNEVFGHSLKGFYDALIGRFSSEGSVVETFKEDGRMATLEIVLANLMSRRDIYLGLGLGGGVLDVYTNGKTAITGFEIGQMSPMIHGGLLFWLFFNAFILYVLSRVRIFKDDPMDFGLWMGVLIFYVFSFMEGIFITNLVCYEVMIYLVIGYLLRKIVIHDRNWFIEHKKIKLSSNRMEFK